MQLHDPIAMEVFTNRLLSITEDMNNTLVRSSFSTNIKERRDCSVALFDGRGRLIAQGTQIPLHLGSLSGGVRAVLGAYPMENMREGDAFICNDPYLANGTHLPDITIVTPVFYEGRIEFFCPTSAITRTSAALCPALSRAARAASSRKAFASRCCASRARDKSTRRSSVSSPATRAIPRSARWI